MAPALRLPLSLSHPLAERRVHCRNKTSPDPNESFYQPLGSPAGDLESPNCVLSETATGEAIILSLLNSFSCLYARAHMWTRTSVCACVCVLPRALKAPTASGSHGKSILFGSSPPLYSFNNSLPLHYCSTDLPSQSPD